MLLPTYASSARSVGCSNLAPVVPSSELFITKVSKVDVYRVQRSRPEPTRSKSPQGTDNDSFTVLYQGRLPTQHSVRIQCTRSKSNNNY